jgi:threonine/homoserine/homoserine lactone efflux protein
MFKARLTHFLAAVAAATEAAQVVLMVLVVAVITILVALLDMVLEHQGRGTMVAAVYQATRDRVAALVLLLLEQPLGLDSLTQLPIHQ